MRFRESRRWLSEADPTRRREAESRSSGDTEEEQEEEENLIEQSVVDKLIEALVLLEERTRN